MVADSRQVALNHTAGLSLPQQIQMALFSLFALLDTANSYKTLCQLIVRRRYKALWEGLGLTPPAEENRAFYYAELDLMVWAEKFYGRDFVKFLRKNYECTDVLFRLAEKSGVVLMHGGGFGGPDWSVRVSLANLPEDTYPKIGQFLKEAAGRLCRGMAGLEKPGEAEEKIIETTQPTESERRQNHEQRSHRICSGVVLTAVVVLTLAASAAQAKPKIMVLATGGTIAGAQATQADAGYKSGSFSVDDLIKAVPQLKNIAELSGEQIANIGSQTMNHEVWLKLAARCNEAAHQSNVDGIVITHGTDTMEETGYFLSLVVKSDKPVVLVGSMRPATAISADGPINLYNARSPRRESRGQGPRRRSSSSTTPSTTPGRRKRCTPRRMDTFASPNRGIAGMMNTGKAFFYSQNTTRHTTKSEFSVAGLKTRRSAARGDCLFPRRLRRRNG